MANKFEDPDGSLPKVVEFIASACDCFLQDMLSASASGDPDAFMVSVAKLEQLGKIINLTFEGVGDMSRNSEVDVANYNSACQAVHEYMVGRLNKILYGDDDSPDTIRNFN